MRFLQLCNMYILYTNQLWIFLWHHDICSHKINHEKIRKDMKVAYQSPRPKGVVWTMNEMERSGRPTIHCVSMPVRSHMLGAQDSKKIVRKDNEA